jgi:glycyl-tRNA synthetase beta chain
MPELLIELFSEEIPARMQKRAEEDLLKLLREKLEARGLAFKGARTFSAPRRLGVSVADLPAKAADVNEEKKGPRVGAPEQAIQGFLKSAGLKTIGEAQVVNDKKGDFYVARIERAGEATAEIVRGVLPEIIRSFPWPKSMRSGASDLQWVRPLHNICCVFDGREVKIDVAGIPSEAATWGHRFHAPAKIAVTNFARYDADLRAAKVIPLREDRKNDILTDAREQCAKRGFELVEDPGLLEEVTGLAEWPQVIFGDMDPAFLDLPAEVIRLSMRTHQKYFAVRDAKTKKLAPHFITVANISAKDGGNAIATGNARVLSARLNDARFFWDTDKKTPLYTDERKEKLKKIVFHQKLGSVWDKVERVKALAVELCAATGADPILVERAALLSKMDLVTETVGEFPELQGQIGRELYLAERNASSPFLRGRGQGEGGRSEHGAARATSSPPPTPNPAPQGGGESIATAIEDHYRPLGPNDRVPTDPVAVTLALADKLDTLQSFWAITERPTGSSDPYALRRAALGFVRTVLGARIRVSLSAWIERAYYRYVFQHAPSAWPYIPAAGQTRNQKEFDYVPLTPPDWLALNSAQYTNGHEALDPIAHVYVYEVGALETHGPRKVIGEQAMWHARLFAECLHDTRRDLLAFLADRLKVQLRDQGKRHDLVDAVFALGDDDLVRIVARVEALDAFLKTEDGANLLAGYKRAANILAAEEKKGKWSAAEAEAPVQRSLLKEEAEHVLEAAMQDALRKARAAVEKEDFAAAMKALSGLRAPVDAFFEKVLVNDPQEHLRRNRLLLLTRLVEATSAVADFSKIEG